MSIVSKSVRMRWNIEKHIKQALMKNGPPAYCLKESKKQKYLKNKWPSSVLRLHLNKRIKPLVAIYRYDLITINYL